MTRTRMIGAVLLLLSGGVLIFFGSAAERARPGQMTDFEGVYYSARCLIHHEDPYNKDEFLKTYRSEPAEFQAGGAITHNLLLGVTSCVNLPSTLFLIIPIAMMPWELAHVIRMGLISASLTVAALSIWDLAEQHSRGVALLLTCFLLANCEIVLAGGNTAGIVLGLCVTASWCFIKDRFVGVGIVALAVSLCIKPHDSGLIWLYFLLAGGECRRRALHTLALAIFLGVLAMAWVSLNAPQWPFEMGRNLAAISSHGGINDPGPAATTGRGPHTIIDLQTVFSIFKDEPRVYDFATNLFCIPLLLTWMLVTFRSRYSSQSAYLGLAAISALSLLPVYHRLYDAKILMLTIPACAMLWAEGGLIGWVALLLNSAGIVLTGDIPSIMLQIQTQALSFSTETSYKQFGTLVMTRPYPIVLFAIAVFYLSVYVRRTRGLKKSSHARLFEEPSADLAKT